MLQQLKKYINDRLKNLLRLTIITLPGKDSGNYSTAQISGLGKTSDNITLVYPYGYQANAPANTLAIAGQLYGQEEALVAMPFNPLDTTGKSIRFQNLKVNEVCIGNPSSKTYIKFTETGGIEIDSKENISVTVAGNVTLNVTGNLTSNVTGNLSVTAGGTANITSTGNCQVVSSGTAKLQATGATTVKGLTVTVDAPSISLGLGAVQGIARIGDTVAVDPITHLGTITSASVVNKSL